MRPWEHEPGIWYHVTTEDRLGGIAAEGLLPDTAEKRFSHEYPRGVYLFGNIEQSFNWFRAEEFDGIPVVLRVVGIADNEVTTDPEFKHNDPDWAAEEPWTQVIYDAPIAVELIDAVQYQTTPDDWRPLAKVAA